MIIVTVTILKTFRLVLFVRALSFSYRPRAPRLLLESRVEGRDYETRR
jgi:hypothetical protein